METTKMSDLNTKVRQVGPFSEISLGGVGDLVIELGDQESVQVRARQDVLPYIVTRVEGNKLILQLKWRGLDGLFRTVGPIHYHVTARQLEAVHVSGSASVTGSGLSGEEFDLGVSGTSKVKLDLTVNRLATHVSGSAVITLSGKTDRQEATISGTGDYRAGELASRECRLTVSGAGKARVQVESELDVHISGTGQVLYAGRPTIRKHVSGVGSVSPIAEIHQE
jgi:hypothetical protein